MRDESRESVVEDGEEESVRVRVLIHVSTSTPRALMDSVAPSPEAHSALFLALEGARMRRWCEMRVAKGRMFISNPRGPEPWAALMDKEGLDTHTAGRRYGW